LKAYLLKKSENSSAAKETISELKKLFGLKEFGEKKYG